MYICIGKLTIIGSDNGLSPERRQAIIRTNAAIFLIRPLGTNFSEILIGNRTFSFKELHLKMSSVKWRPFCLCLNVITGLTVIYNRPWSPQMRTPWSMNLESYTGEWFSRYTDYIITSDYIYLSEYGSDIFCGISKESFEILHIHWEICFRWPFHINSSLI